LEETEEGANGPNVEDEVEMDIESDDDEIEAEPEVGAASSSNEDSQEDDDDEDDMMAMFREVKVGPSTPAALSDAFEEVRAVDLLTQAREIRDLLRGAASAAGRD
jgi:hypothetical protein